MAVNENTVPFSSRMSSGLGALLLGTLAPVHRGQGRPEGRGRWPQISSGRSDKQGDLGSYKTSRSQHPPARILKVYNEALMGFSHMHHPDGLHTTLLFQGCVLGAGPTVGTGNRPRSPRTWEGARKTKSLSSRNN